MVRTEQRMVVRAPRRPRLGADGSAYRALLQALYEAVLITDQDGAVLEANPRAERFARAPAGGLRGRSVFDVILGSGPDVLAQAGRNLDAGRFTVLDAYFRRLDGTTFPAEIAVSRMPHKDSARLVFSLRNVSWRRRLEAQLRREAEAQMNRAREQDDFSGLLNIVSMGDVIQLIDASRKSGWLSLRDEAHDEVGRIGFVEGRTVAVRCADARGEAAFQALLRQGGASFVFEQGVPKEHDEGLEQSTMGLLLEASRVLDEEDAEAMPDGVAMPSPGRE